MRSNSIQCAILVGGLGTRLGSLTAASPKPLLKVGDRPFLEIIISEAYRFGFRKFLLLAGYLSDRVADFVANSPVCRRPDIKIEISVEPTPMGTGGALVHAMPKLEAEFLLLNGDTWFDFNWLDLVARARSTNCQAAIGIRTVESADRYHKIELEGASVVSIERAGRSGEPAMINGGVYYFRREAFEGMPSSFSLEGELLPKLTDVRRLDGYPYSGFFIDIGIPETFDLAQTIVSAARNKPAAFLDRDGVLNEDINYLHRISDLKWTSEAKDAVKMLNDSGYYVFVVTNQAGVAHGYYDEAAIAALHAAMASELADEGAHIDDWRYCPYHPQAKVAKYLADHDWRKPKPGMLLDLLEKWPVSKEHSFMIGDQPSDLAAARAAGIGGHLFGGGSLLATVRNILGRKT